MIKVNAFPTTPNEPNLFFNRGSAWEEKNNLQNALADYKKFSELQPTDPTGPKAVERVTKALAQESDGGPVSVNIILPACKKIVTDQRPTGTLEALQLGQCMGILQTLITVGAVMKPDFGFCLPEGSITAKQASSVIIQYVESHPERQATQKGHSRTRRRSSPVAKTLSRCRSRWRPERLGVSHKHFVIIGSLALKTAFLCKNDHIYLASEVDDAPLCRGTSHKVGVTTYVVGCSSWLRPRPFRTICRRADAALAGRKNPSA